MANALVTPLAHALLTLPQPIPSQPSPLTSADVTRTPNRGGTPLSSEYSFGSLARAKKSLRRRGEL